MKHRSIWVKSHGIIFKKLYLEYLIYVVVLQFQKKISSNIKRLCNIKKQNLKL